MLEFLLLFLQSWNSECSLVLFYSISFLRNLQNGHCTRRTSKADTNNSARVKKQMAAEVAFVSSTCMAPDRRAKVLLDYLREQKHLFILAGQLAMVVDLAG